MGETVNIDVSLLQKGYKTVYSYTNQYNEQIYAIQCQNEHVLEGNKVQDLIQKLDKQEPICKICSKNKELQNWIDDYLPGYTLNNYSYNHARNLMINLTCEKKHDIEDIDYSSLKRRAEKGNIQIICKTCWKESLVKEFSSYQLVVVDKNEVQNASDNVKCMNHEGLYVETNLVRLRQGKEPSPFKNGKYAEENVSILAKKRSITLDEDYKYEDYDTPAFGTNAEGQRIKFRIHDLRNGHIPNPIHKGNDYSIANIQKDLDNKGIKVELDLDQEFHGVNVPIKGTDEDGNEVQFRYSDIIQGKKPRVFHTSNPASISNFQKLIDEMGMGYTLLEGQTYEGTSIPLAAVDKEGFKVMITVDTVKSNKHPNKFHPSNPFTLENISLYCSLNQPEFDIAINGQTYINAKKKMTFLVKSEYSKTRTEELFEMSWDNFKKGNSLERFVG